MNDEWNYYVAPVGGERRLCRILPIQTNEDGGTLCARVREATHGNGEGEGWVADICWAFHPPGSSWYGAEPRAKNSQPVPFSEYSQEAVENAIKKAALICGMRDVSQDEDTCPIWNTPATIYAVEGDSRTVDSPQAGGKYWISGTAVSQLKDQKRRRELQEPLTAWLNKERQGGNDCPRISAAHIEGRIVLS